MPAQAIACGLASALFWMRIVYKRYETTVALPIEYGALNAGNLLGGMLVYAEDECMEGCLANPDCTVGYFYTPAQSDSSVVMEAIHLAHSVVLTLFSACGGSSRCFTRGRSRAPP